MAVDDFCTMLCEAHCPIEPDLPDVPETEQEWATIRVGTYNFGNGPRKRKDRDMRVIKREADIVGFQETGDQWETLKDHPGFTVYHDDGGSSRGKTAIMVRNSVGKIADFGVERLSDKTHVGSRGAGGSVQSPHWICWGKIRLKDAGRALNFASVHFTPSVMQAKHFPGRDIRRRLFREQVAGTVEWLKSRDGHGMRMVVGDFNATPGFFLMKPLRRMLKILAPKSHGGKAKNKRAIDHVSFIEQGKIKHVDTETFVLSSDHRLVVSTFRIRVK